MDIIKTIKSKNYATDFIHLFLLLFLLVFVLLFLFLLLIITAKIFH